MDSDRLTQAREVKERLRDRLAGNPRVKGVGLAVRTDGHAVRVLVADRVAAAELGLDTELDGVPIEVVAVGEVTAQG